MADAQTFNIYCDESCHLEHDGIPVMVWGALCCREDARSEISEEIRSLKAKHGIATSVEIKWTKISPAKREFYAELTRYFLADDRLTFRALVVPDKSKIDHSRFNQSHDQWYYKMYFTLLKYMFRPPHHYRIYLDVKDTQGGPKTRKLHDVLANRICDWDKQYVERVQQIRSHESELLQLCDVLIGATGYANRNLSANAGKKAVVDQLHSTLGQDYLRRSSSFGATKFNLLIWSPQEAGE